MKLIIHGTPVLSNAWDTPSDVAMFSNEKAVQKVRSGLAAIPIEGTVHIHFDEWQHADIFGFGTAASRANLCDYFATQMSDGINCFVRNNMGSKIRHNPLTTWILMHRLGHSYHAIDHRGMQIVSNCEDELLAVFDEAPRRQIDHLSDTHLITRACTMRSARNRQLYAFAADIMAELFAQYVITGDIRFKKADEWNFDQYKPNYGENDLNGERSYKVGKHWAKITGNITQFYVSLNQEFTDDKKLRCDEVMEKYQPLFKSEFDRMLEVMKTIPNIM